MEQQQRKGRAMESKTTDHELLKSSKRESSSFFKIMIGDFKNVLFIPPQFARTVRSLVDQTVFLRDSNGQTWRVKLLAINDRLAFQEGWHDFVVDHFITVGELVVFKYTDRAAFKVDVFGTSCCKRTNFDEERKKSSTGPKRKAVEVRYENVQSSKKQKTSNEIIPVEGVPNFPCSKEIIDTTKEEGRKCRSVSKKISKKPDDKGRPPKERKEEFKSLQKGKAIQAKVESMDENKAIQVKIGSMDEENIALPAFASFRFSLSLISQTTRAAFPGRLPSQFGKTRYSRQVIVLRDPCRRLWPVLYHEDLKFAGFIGGWEYFFRANKLKEGDLCEFEVALGSDNMLDVQIIRV